MSIQLVWPFVLQGVVMLVDEFYCHQMRPLRRWEKWGHPLDTLVFLSVFLWLQVNPPSPFSIRVYFALSGFSCLMITKDEWEHHGSCTPFENWLHALLFVLHPLVLLWAGWLWWQQVEGWQSAFDFVVVGGGALFLHQTFYWNWWRRDKQRTI